MDSSAHEANRLSWNKATNAHNSHKSDQAAFFRAGGMTLFPEEIELLGDVQGESIVHLQCNAGQDTLSLATLGAVVTGVDISDVAVDFARRLSNESGIKAEFHRADIYDWLVETIYGGSTRFDIAFSSYGALCWLSDLNLWAKSVAGVLKPGGRLVVVDFHPLLTVFEEDWSIKYDYFGSGAAVRSDDGIRDYVAVSGQALAPSGYLDGITDFANPYPSYEFQWAIGDIVSAVVEAGFLLTALNEYPFMNGAKLLSHMIEGENGRMYPPKHIPQLPLMYGLSARLSE
jgi:SAM-dependent methyltransferase